MTPCILSSSPGSCTIWVQQLGCEVVGVWSAQQRLPGEVQPCPCPWQQGVEAPEVSLVQGGSSSEVLETEVGFEPHAAQIWGHDTLPRGSTEPMWGGPCPQSHIMMSSWVQTLGRVVVGVSPAQRKLPGEVQPCWCPWQGREPRCPGM